MALARACAQSRVLLMDEPFAALDALTREQLYGDLQKFGRADARRSCSSHNVREAVCLRRVVLLSPSPGRIREQFTVALPRPRTSIVWN